MMLQAFHDLQAQLVDVMTGEAGSLIVGRRHGTLVCVRVNYDAFFITTALPHWPLDILMRSPVIARKRTTGDAEFDMLVEVHPGNGGWRLVLDPTQRERLMELCHRRYVLIGSRVLNTRVEHAHARGLIDVIDLVCSIAAAPVAWGNGVEETVFAMARAEPNAAVRLNHYVWLVSRQWNPPFVFRVAQADSDASIRRWAADNLPAEMGAFR